MEGSSETSIKLNKSGNPKGPRKRRSKKRILDSSGSVRSSKDSESIDTISEADVTWSNIWTSWGPLAENERVETWNTKFSNGNNVESNLAYVMDSISSIADGDSSFSSHRTTSTVDPTSYYSESLELLVQDLSKFAHVTQKDNDTNTLFLDASRPRAHWQQMLQPYSAKRILNPEQVRTKEFLKNIIAAYDEERDDRVSLAVKLAEAERMRRINMINEVRFQEKLERARNLEWAINATEAERSRHSRRDRVEARRLQRVRHQVKRDVISQEEAERQRRIERGASDDIILAAARERKISGKSSDSTLYDEAPQSSDSAENSDGDHEDESFLTDYEVVCPYTIIGCNYICQRSQVQDHLQKCPFRSSGEEHLLWSNESFGIYNPLECIVQCPYSTLGCIHSCPRARLPEHLKTCQFHDGSVNLENYVTDDLGAMAYEVVCPFALSGCCESVLRPDIQNHIKHCRFAPKTRQEEESERAQNKLMAIEAAEKERKRRIHNPIRTHERAEYRKLLVALLREKFSESHRGSANDRVRETSAESSTEEASSTKPHSTVVFESHDPSLPLTDTSARWIVKAAEIEALHRHLMEKARKTLPTSDTVARCKLTQRSKSAPCLLRYSINSEEPRSRRQCFSPDRLTRFYSRRKMSQVHGNDEDQALDQGKSSSFNRRYTDRAMPPHALSVHEYMEGQMQAMHQELCRDIEKFAASTEESTVEYSNTIDSICDRVRQTVKERFCQDVTVKVFGSFGSNLAVPNISDLDLVISNGMDYIGSPEMCRALGNALISAPWVVAEKVKILDKAKMPVIKLVTRELPEMLPMHVDITFALPFHAGLAAAYLLRNLQRQYPALHALALVLKVYIAQKGLSDPFTGGLSSYALSLMIVASLNRSYEGPKPVSTLSYGELLLGFLELYGKEFDAQEDAVVSLRGTAESEYTICVGRRLYALSSPYTGADFNCMPAVVVDDPIQAGNNTASTCFRFGELQKAFADSYALLLVHTARRTKATQCILDLFLDSGLDRINVNGFTRV